MLEKRGLGKAPSVAAFLPLLDRGQSLFRFVLLGKAPGRVDRRGQCFAGALFVSSFQGRQAEMVLDDGLVGLCFVRRATATSGCFLPDVDSDELLHGLE